MGLGGKARGSPASSGQPSADPVSSPVCPPGQGHWRPAWEDCVLDRGPGLGGHRGESRLPAGSQDSGQLLGCNGTFCEAGPLGPLPVWWSGCDVGLPPRSHRPACVQCSTPGSPGHLVMRQLGGTHPLVTENGAIKTGLPKYLLVFTTEVICLTLLVHTVKFCFHFFRNCQTVFHSGCTIMHSQEQCRRVPVSPRPHHSLLSFLVTAIPARVTWYLTVILICISLPIVC